MRGVERNADTLGLYYDDDWAASIIDVGSCSVAYRLFRLRIDSMYCMEGEYIKRG